MPLVICHFQVIDGHSNRIECHVNTRQQQYSENILFRGEEEARIIVVQPYYNGGVLWCLVFSFISTIFFFSSAFSLNSFNLWKENEGTIGFAQNACCILSFLLLRISFYQNLCFCFCFCFCKFHFISKHSSARST